MSTEAMAARGGRSRRGDPEHVAHLVATRGAPGEPARGTQRALGEQRSIRRLVHELHALPRAQEQDPMLAHYATTPYGVKADLAARPLADGATSAIAPRLGQIHVPSGRHCPAERERGAARCIGFTTVVAFHDLDIVMVRI